MKRLKLRGRERIAWTLAVAGAVLLIPGVQVGCVACINPPSTAPMLSRALGRSGAWKGPASIRYKWVALNEVPESFLSCVWISEDHRFFEHWGFNWEQIRIAWAEARASGRPARGASTITQQSARALFLWQGRSWVRKGLEAYYTVWMELLLSKGRILELYVNVIEMGDGVYGIEAAAQRHYGVHARELTREQAAMLVAILPKPRDWDPNRPNERVLRRQAIIVERAEHARLPAEALR